MRTRSHPRGGNVIVAPKIGQHHIQVVELPGHRVQPGGHLLTPSLERRSLTERFTGGDCGTPEALPGEIGKPAVDAVELGRKTAQQVGQPITVCLHPGQSPHRCRRAAIDILRRGGRAVHGSSLRVRCVGTVMPCYGANASTSISYG